MTQPLKIVRAGTGDAALIASLAREIWPPHYTPIVGAQQVGYMLDHFQSEDAILKDMQKGMAYDIAFWNGAPCGYSAVRPGSDGVYLSKLYVHHKHRQKGVGRAMLDRIAACAAQQRQPRIWLTCNKHNAKSLAAYARLGFAVIGAAVTDIGDGFVMDDFVLEKKLP